MDKTNAPEELLDLVNENDEVIGTVRKGDANANPKLIHREVTILIYNDKNEVLFQKRSHKKIVSPGIWASGAAGHVPQGMNAEEAAHKELEEELGFDIPLTFIGKRLNSIKTETRIDYLFIGKYTDQKIHLNSDEVEEVRFFSQKEIEEMEESESDISPRAMDKAFKFWNQKFIAYTK